MCVHDIVSDVVDVVVPYLLLLLCVYTVQRREARCFFKASTDPLPLNLDRCKALEALDPTKT